MARAFCLSAGFGITALAGTVLDAASTGLLLLAVAAVMCLWATSTRLYESTYVYGLVAEGSFALILVCLSGGASDPYILYVGAPALLSGLRAGLFASFGLVLVESLALLAIYLQEADARPYLMDVAVPWVLMAAALAVLGSWIRILSMNSSARQSPYASAHKLLAQLRTVTRDLPGGLDIESVTQAVLTDASDALGGSRSILLLVSESGQPVVVGHHTDEAFTANVRHDKAVRDTIKLHRVTQQAIPSGRAPHRYRTSLPVLVGTRCIGAVVVDGPAPASAGTVGQVLDELADAALRLESAVLFGDVRALATVEERHRLAREIHDGIAQEIASLGYLVDDIAREQCDRNHRVGLLDLRDELTRVVTELRLSIFDLRSGVSTNAGLGAVLGDYVREVGKNSGMTVHMSLEESTQRLRLDVETELLRIAQEAVNNARKHSGGDNLWVTCRVEPPFAEIRIEDDGRGSAAVRKHHYGLHTMKERADRINAVLTVSDRQGGGTAVSAVLVPADMALPNPRNGENHALHRAAG